MENAVQNVVQKVISYMERYRMLLPGERAVAGVSGGADSVCLLFLLLEWKKRHGLELAVVHVNHGIRPEAGEDARFVKELCRQQGIPFFLREVDVRTYAAERKCSEEEAGRILRYEAFAAVAEEFRADKIAVAHNLGDRAETMLFHLFRGSGIRGLAGILPVRESRECGNLAVSDRMSRECGNLASSDRITWETGASVRIIRPLLCLERGEIENYLAACGQTYCEDATNEKDDYTRNRIRHHILPYVEREIAPGCVRHIGGAAELLEETEDYLEQQTREALSRCVRTAPDSGGAYPDAADSDTAHPAAEPGLAHPGATASAHEIDVAAFLDCHPALQKRMLHALLKSLSPGAKDISRIHVEDMLALFSADTNRKINLPFGIVARREYDRVWLGRGREAGAAEALAGVSMRFSVFSAENLPKNAENIPIFPENKYTKWFDYDKIIERPILRTRATGDFLTIADGQGGMHHKSLQDYMVTEKIPERRRDSVPVLADGSHVLWLVGYRISQYYKITGNTKHVLQVQLSTEQETEDKNGRTD